MNHEDTDRGSGPASSEATSIRDRRGDWDVGLEVVGVGVRLRLVGPTRDDLGGEVVVLVEHCGDEGPLLAREEGGEG